MNKIPLKFDIEKIVLILFFAFMMYYGCAQVNEYKINIDYPRGFRASDALWHPSLERHILDAGSYKYNPAYIVFGYNDTVGAYPPIRPYSIAMLSFLTGIDPYNLMFFVLAFITTFSALIMYLIIRNYNKHVALLSLPLMPFVFHGNFYVGITWGQFGFVMGSLFLIAIAYALTKLELINSYILLGLFLTGAALSHTTEVVLAIGFISIFVIMGIIQKNLTITTIKKIILAIIIMVILSVYYLIIFKYTWMEAFSNYKTFAIITQVGFPIGKMLDFGWLIPFLIIGIILNIIAVFTQKKIAVGLLLGLYMFVVGYLNYGLVMFANSAFQTRFIWPLYLSVFLGLSVYQGLKFIFKEVNIIMSSCVSVLIILLLLFTFYEKNNPSGIMDIHLWNSFDWIRSNTPKDSNLYFLYGDRYQQSAILFATERNAWKVDPQDYFATLQNQTVKRVYASYTNQFMTYTRQGLFKFVKRPWPPWEKDICTFDYYVFDKQGQYQPLLQYNNYIENMFLNLGWMEKVYNNPLLDIVKNNKPGVNCVIAQNRTTG